MRLADRAALWNARRENRYLPSWWEHAGIRLFTDRRTWSPSQSEMMRRAGRVHAVYSFIFAGLLLAVILCGLAIRSTFERRQRELVAQKQAERMHAEAARLVEGLLQAETGQVGAILGQLEEYRPWAEEDLQAAFAGAADESPVIPPPAACCNVASRIPPCVRLPAAVRSDSASGISRRVNSATLSANSAHA